MSIAHPDTVKWITIQIADITARGNISRFELYHTDADQQPAERLQISSVEEGIDPQDLGQSLWEMAENDAASRALGTPQRYVIWSFRGESQEYDSQFAFSIRGKSLMKGNLDMGESSDPANERGHTGQMMRHNESLHRMMMLMTDATAGRLASELQQERKRREEVENKMMDVMQLHQNLLDKKADRELAEARETAKARRHDELMGFFMAMAPLMASKFLGIGGEMGGTPTAMRDKAVGQIIERLSEKEASGVFNSLDGHNKLLFTELRKSYQEPTTGPASVMRDKAVAKILENLSEKEAMGVFNSLEGANKVAFTELYQSYAKDHIEDQSKKPIPFRDPKTGKKPGSAT